MEFWDNVIHTALLGTDKKVLKKEELPSGMAGVYDVISNGVDKEDEYLRLAGLAFNYRKCGAIPLQKSVVYSIAEDETKAYAGAAAHQVLTAVLSSESNALLELWLRECNNKPFTVQPEFIPGLFDLSMKQKALQSSIINAAGKRGEWLLSLNESWKIKAVAHDEAAWQTGSLDERKLYLNELRKEDSGKGRELLQEIWSQENANTKAELLKQLNTGINSDDAEWLESLCNDKSGKVKEEAMKLLKQLPQSSIVQRYWNVIRQSIHIKKEKGFLRIGNKITLDITFPKQVDEAIFKTGIEKISSGKNESDEDFILHQLISAVPPSFFEQEFALSKEDIVDVFQQSKMGKRFVPAFGLAAVRFKDTDWIKAIIAKAEKQFYPEALLLLPDNEKDSYALQFISDANAADTIIHSLQEHLPMWSLALTKEVFRHTAKQHYRYNQSFYKENILRFPIDIIPQLEKCTPQDEWARNQWSKTSEYIIQLLTLRIQILQAFQS